MIHKKLSVGHGINSIVGYAVLSFYPKHYPVAGGGKSINFSFPCLEIRSGIHSQREKLSHRWRRITSLSQRWLVGNLSTVFPVSKKALHANALRRLRLLAADAILESRYLKSVTWLMGSP